MEKQKRQAIGQMILAAAMCAAVVIPGMVAVNAATEKEQATLAKQAEQKTAAVMFVEPEEQPAPLKYWDSIPLAAELQNYIVETSDTYGIQPEIIMAIIDRESEFDISAIGDKGQAFGLMQVHPRWHYQRMVDLGCTDLLDGYQNIAVGIDYLAELTDIYDGNIAKALTAYNQGQYNGTVTQYAKAVIAAAERLGETDALHE